ncbi:MAG: sulfur carrier protein ThiS [Planctomycetota bacterium]|nr:sulfur carrier protein ThiS [Planctomycetota bacterium]
MIVHVNGESLEIPPKMSLRELIVHLGMGDRPCAVEINKKLVPRREHETRILAAGEAIEVVTLVGGG